MSPSYAAGSWQVDIMFFWKWTTREGMSLEDAWDRLEMHPRNARASLHPHAWDKGMIPPKLFSRVLARSRARKIDPDDIVDPVELEDAPPAAPPEDTDKTPVGFTFPDTYRPRAKWRNKLDAWAKSPPGNVGNWRWDIGKYWELTAGQGLSPKDAWKEVEMTADDATMAIDPKSFDKGLIPPDVIGRVVARAWGLGPDAEVAVVCHPEPSS
jgi:hypothetical protein